MVASDLLAAKQAMIETDQTTKTGRSARRASGTRKKLLDSAADMFNTVGFDACTIEDITERADVGKGTFYRHFEDKYAIITTLVETTLGELRNQLRAVRGAARQPPELLQSFFDVHSALFTSQPEAFLLLFQGRLQLKFHRGQAEALEHAFQAYLTEMEQALAPLLPPPADAVRARRVVCALVGFVSGFISVAGLGARKEEVSAGLAAVRQPFLSAAGEILQ